MLKNMGVAVTMPIFEPSSPSHSNPVSKQHIQMSDYRGIAAERLQPRFCIYGTNELDHYLSNVLVLNYRLSNLKI